MTPSPPERVDRLRVPYGLDRLPAGLSADDPRLPHVDLDTRAFRLNSEPVPARFLAPRMTNATMLAAAADWLKSACGDYAVGMRLFIDAYLAFAAAEVARQSDDAAGHLARFDGLYKPRTLLWSALRPLPRAWLPGPDGSMHRVDLAFWDGDGFIRVGIGRTAEQGAAEVDVVLGEDGLRRHGPVAIAAALPQLTGFWRDEILPSSPFRTQWSA